MWILQIWQWPKWRFVRTPYCSWKIWKYEKYEKWEYEKYENIRTWWNIKKSYMKRGHVWEYFQILRKKHDLLLALVLQVSFNEIESLLRSSIKPKCDNWLHIDLHILYFHQIECVTIFKNTLNQMMFRCHILFYYSNWK